MIHNRPTAIRVMQDTEIEFRTEQLFGRDFLVVPTVAIVQGVLWPMNAPHAELALASEFGKVPDGWNGRPIMMNHPQIDGTPVSASTPQILQDYCFGYMFNTRVEDQKLKTEAWLDISRAAELGGEIQETVERVQNGSIVEVSVGIYTDTELVEGQYNGREYGAIWRNVTPDHLALLSVGVKGACSVEDGCGAARQARANTANDGWSEYTMPKNMEVLTAAGTKPLTTGGCGCGGTAADCQCDGDHKHTNAEATPSFEVNRFLANAIPNGMMDNDVRKLLQQAITASNAPNSYVYVVGFTAEKVIYERYSDDDYTYSTYQRDYSIGDDRAVVLGEDESKVNILMEIVPASSVTANSAETPEENVMPDNIAAGSQVTTPAPTPTPTPTPGTPSVPINAAADQRDQQAQQPRTLSEHLEAMPEEMREYITAGLRLQAEHKATVIGALRASGRCNFTDEQLNTMSIEMLDNLSVLASVPSYEGFAAPRQAAAPESPFAPEPPRAF